MEIVLSDKDDVVPRGVAREVQSIAGLTFPHPSLDGEGRPSEAEAGVG